MVTPQFHNTFRRINSPSIPNVILFSPNIHVKIFSTVLKKLYEIWYTVYYAPLSIRARKHTIIKSSVFCICLWSVLTVCVSFAAATYFSFNKYFTMKDNPVNQGDLLAINTSLSYYTNLADTWLVLGQLRAVTVHRARGSC